MERATTRPGPEDLLRHADFVRGLARALVADPAGADDLSQEAFAVALRSPPAHAGNLRAWFSRLLRNLLRTGWRADVRRAARAERVARDRSAPAAATVAAELEVQRQLVAAVQELTEPFRTAVVLRFFHGLTPAEIGARTGASPKTVSSRLSRALARLRDRLDERHGGRRGSWTAALVPLAVSRPIPTLALAGGALVSAKFLVAGAAAAVLLVSAVFLASSRPELAEPEPAPPEVTRAPAVPVEAAQALPEESKEVAGGPAGLVPDPGEDIPAAESPGEDEDDLAWRLAVEVVDTDGEPYAGARVVFMNEAGEVVAEGTADAEGKATLAARGKGMAIAFGSRPGWQGVRMGIPPAFGHTPEGRRRYSVRLTIRDPDPFGTPEPEEALVRGGAGGIFGGRGGHRNLRSNGGGKATQSAADLALQWLCDHRLENGSWENDVSFTSLALLAFLGGGETHRHGMYKKTISGALAWLLERQDGSGRFSADPAVQSVAALAVVEAWGLTGSTALREAAEQAVGEVVRAGMPSAPLDVLREWHLLAVAKELGQDVEPGPISDRRLQLTQRWSTTTGAVEEEPRTALTGGLLFLLLRADPQSIEMDRVRRASQFVRDSLDEDGNGDPLDRHYGSLGVFMASRKDRLKDWKAVNRAVQLELPKTQVKEGADTGSWDPADGFGRVATTALNASTLQVYYRYLRP